ncbi:protein FAR1-RELATED SEQUENCE 1-like [Chenopodium quinoa]|uniref:protein FAR1-RELATED SEQUENCE 1-like n=1 Tax=Chenopodium quinoa TaxID=63459 RepID=UPI000B776F0A|nr:protein FAR1-RELATED SEQUENCE 1-like [Chenopodium quinoa]
MYTFSNFYKFQKEFWGACMDFEIEEKKDVDEGQLIIIADVSYKNSKTRKIIYNPLNHIAQCSCKMFECEGIPCRHILCVLKGKCLPEVPSYYILRRWTKMAASKPIFNLDDDVEEGNSQIKSEEKLISDNWCKFLNCMDIAGRDPKQLTIVLKGIENISTQLIELKGNVTESKTYELESFIGLSAPEEVEILPPKQANTKGSGSGGGKRFRGGKEVSMEQQAKKKRHCKTCGEQAYHDSRNFPTKQLS